MSSILVKLGRITQEQYNSKHNSLTKGTYLLDASSTGRNESNPSKTYSLCCRSRKRRGLQTHDSL